MLRYYAMMDEFGGGKKLRNNTMTIVNLRKVGGVGQNNRIVSQVVRSVNRLKWWLMRNNTDINTYYRY